MAKSEQTESTGRLCCPERTHELLRLLYGHTGCSMSSYVAEAVDLLIKDRTRRGEWVPSKRDLRGKR